MVDYTHLVYYWLVENWYNKKSKGLQFVGIACTCLYYLCILSAFSAFNNSKRDILGHITCTMDCILASHPAALGSILKDHLHWLFQLKPHCSAARFEAKVFALKQPSSVISKVRKFSISARSLSRAISNSYPGFETKSLSRVVSIKTACVNEPLHSCHLALKPASEEEQTK